MLKSVHFIWFILWELVYKPDFEHSVPGSHSHHPIETERLRIPASVLRLVMTINDDRIP